MLRTPLCLSAALVLFLATLAPAGVGPEKTQKLYADVAPSLVAVKYTLVAELQRVELIGPGIVVGEDGLVMAPMILFHANIPDEQMQDFKIVVPHQDKDPEELDAVFHGRDERTNMAFLKTKSPQKWKPLKFEDAPVNIGDTVLSVGTLPKGASYKPYVMEATVAALLRGEVPQVLVPGGLTAYGSPVFNADGKAIGMVNFQVGQPAMLNDPATSMGAIENPPKFYVPASFFLRSLSDPPTPEKPIVMPWLGVVQLSGVNEALAEVMGLKNQPAIQIGGVIPGMPADKAGLKKGNIIVKVNGEPLERGDEPLELPAILQRRLAWFKPGEQVTFSVLTGKNQPLKDVTVTLDPMPKRQNLAKRHYFEDLGFSVREIVFGDTFAQRLAADAKGVVVSLVRPQGAAHSGGLQPNDLVQELNREPVTDLEQFKKAYEDFRKAKPAEAVVMVVLREGQTKVIRTEPPQ